ncbi:MAG: RHS repeat-associated core domain-containing protein [Gammaproteobacteria bacterium]|nr:RHS repeat-associated core domain-containing protein [Gammaproteobacteria bacterium]
MGSVTAISNNVGRVLERYDYRAFGQRYRVATQSPLNPIGELFTRRGYTGHEEIEEMGLIHMNGRVYDPKLARFLSADPHVQLPDSTQGFNRYAYVQNNPIKYTDPSGFLLSGLWKAVGNMFSAMGSQLLAGLNSITRFVQTYGTIWMYGKITLRKK